MHPAAARTSLTRGGRANWPSRTDRTLSSSTRRAAAIRSSSRRRSRPAKRRSRRPCATRCSPAPSASARRPGAARGRRHPAAEGRTEPPGLLERGGSSVWAGRAIDLGERLGDAEALVSASAASASRRPCMAPGRTQKLEQALARATEEGLVIPSGSRRPLPRHGRLPCTVDRGYGSSRRRRNVVLRRTRRASLRGRYLRAMRSWIELERGNWDLAADTVSLVLSEQCRLSCLQARIVLGLLRARRGDARPWTPLAGAWSVAE